MQFFFVKGKYEHKHHVEVFTEAICADFMECERKTKEKELDLASLVGSFLNNHCASTITIANHR